MGGFHSSFRDLLLVFGLYLYHCLLHYWLSQKIVKANLVLALPHLSDKNV
jgi:hypothetical protein